MLILLKTKEYRLTAGMVLLGLGVLDEVPEQIKIEIKEDMKNLEYFYVPDEFIERMESLLKEK